MATEDSAPAVDVSRAPFADRRDAGRHLAAAVDGYRVEDPVVVGLACGGMPVAAEVARALAAPLEAVLVADVRVGDQVVAMAAAPAVTVFDDAGALTPRAGQPDVSVALGRARADLTERKRRYFSRGRRVAVAGRTVLLVDDLLDASLRARTAARSLRARGAARLVLAVPSGTVAGLEAVQGWFDDVVCLVSHDDSAGQPPAYEDVTEISDEEVVALLSLDEGVTQRRADISLAPGVTLRAELDVPWGAYGRGVILLPYLDPAPRTDERARTMADVLRRWRFATVRAGLLTDAEQADPDTMPDLDVLVHRTIGVVQWLRRQPETARLGLGLLGGRREADAVVRAAARLRAGVCGVMLHDLDASPATEAPRLAEDVAQWFAEHLSDSVPAAPASPERLPAH